MKSPTEYLQDFEDLYKKIIKPFPINNFVDSCLIYSKRIYGIFLLVDTNNDKFIVKVTTFGGDTEVPISLYIKQFASHIPNILHSIDIYRDKSPAKIPLFLKSELSDRSCKDQDITKIFIEHTYSYYLTKACEANLGAYLGKLKNTISYNQFVGYSFQVLVGVQTLHRLGILHRDIKPANFIICNSDINTEYILYNYNNKRCWVFSHDKLEGKFMKLIDFGESIVYNNIGPEFRSEIQVQLVTIIKLMWKYVTNKDDESHIVYQELIHNLKNNTNLVEVMFVSSIYETNITSKCNLPNTHHINMLSY